MALRFVLVSVVAGLGLSLPTRSQVSAWADTTQVWLASRLASWDAQMPAGGDAFVFVADSAPPAPPRVATAGVAPALPPASAITTPTPTPTPKPAAMPTPESLAGTHRPRAGVEFCLTAPDPVVALLVGNEARELAWTSPEPVAARVVPVATVVTTPKSSPAPKAVPTPETKTAAAPKAAEAPKVVVAPKPAPDASFDTAMGAVLTSFAADVPARPIPTIVKDAPKPAAAPPVVADRRPDGPAPAVPNARPSAKVSPSILTTPAAVREVAFPGLAAVLTGPATMARTDAPTHASTQVVSAETDTARTDRLSHAVRLTREAVYAWANLLHGPAVVTISR